MKGNFLNWIFKAIKNTVNIMLTGEILIVYGFILKFRTRYGCLLSLFLLDIVMYVLPRTIRPEKV